MIFAKDEMGVNMKRRKQIIHLLIVCMLTLSICTIASYARPIVYEDQDITLGRVLEVISGEAIKVLELDRAGNGRVRLVRMVGIETDSSQEAFDYVYDRLLGRRIMLLPDDHEDTFPIRSNWIFRHVYLTSKESVAEELLARGLAKLNAKFDQSEQYADLSAAELVGKQDKKGIWNNVNTQSKMGININTGTSTELMEILEDTTYSMANAITRYRKYNVFNNIKEIKYVGSEFSKKWFEKNRYKLSVITNLNNASFEEVRSLFGDMNHGEQVANDFIQYRMFNDLGSLYELKSLAFLKSDYSKVEPFISLAHMEEFTPKEKGNAININTASMNQMIRTCLFTHSKAGAIVKDRDKQKYMFKSFGYLEKNNLLSKYDVAFYSDNITFYTDINTAGLNELESLFGFMDISEDKMKELGKSLLDHRPYENIYDVKYIIGYNNYRMIKPYIYIDKKETEYLNINLTDRETAASILGMVSADREKYLNNTSRYHSRSKIKFDYSYYAESMTLYTNINEANLYELKRIQAKVWKDSRYMYQKLPKAIINDIIKFREDQPFCAKEELYEIFKEHKQISMYNNIIDYIVYK